MIEYQEQPFAYVYFKGNFSLGFNLGTSYLYFSEDSGNTWKELTSVGERGWYMADLSSDGTHIVACAMTDPASENVEPEHVCLSIKSGTITTMQRISANDNQGWRALCVSDDVSVVACISYQRELYLSFDNGASWAKCDTAPLNLRSICVSPVGKHIAVIDLDGGVYVSSDTGATWTKKLDSSNYSQLVRGSKDSDFIISEFVIVDIDGTVTTIDLS